MQGGKPRIFLTYCIYKARVSLLLLDLYEFEEDFLKLHLDPVDSRAFMFCDKALSIPIKDARDFVERCSTRDLMRFLFSLKLTLLGLVLLLMYVFGYFS